MWASKNEKWTSLYFRYRKFLIPAWWFLFKYINFYRSRCLTSYRKICISILSSSRGIVIFILCYIYISNNFKPVAVRWNPRFLYILYILCTPVRGLIISHAVQLSVGPSACLYSGMSHLFVYISFCCFYMCMYVFLNVLCVWHDASYVKINTCVNN